MSIVWSRELQSRSTFLQLFLFILTIFLYVKGKKHTTENTRNCYRHWENKFIIEHYKLTETWKALKDLKDRSQSSIEKNSLQFAMNLVDEKREKVTKKIEHYDSWRNEDEN